jgi:hypothetical protein
MDNILINFLIRNSKYNGKNFEVIFNGVLYIGNSLTEIADKIKLKEDFFSNIIKDE